MWHAVRDGVVDRVVKILGGDGEPAVAALTGRSGAGKTTVAAAMVGDRGPVRARAGETEEQARTRLDRVRALFHDGVVWLRVGKGGGAADRLYSLMWELAKALHANVMENHVDPPTVGEDGERYVKKMVSQEKLRCLVVADDVWEAEVVEKLRETGMWVLMTTRTASVAASMVKPNERVVMDKLTPIEAEDVLRGAANIPPCESLCDGARDVLKICDHVAMDIAFVGSWSPVRAVNGKLKSSKAWASAASAIMAEIDNVRGQALLESSGGMDDLDINRLAIQRVGFQHLGWEDPLASKLYVALAVFPDGYSFGTSDTAELLGDEEVAVGPLEILERWAVVRADTSEQYRMHDAHVSYARDRLMGWEDVRKPTVDRWTSRISRLDFAVKHDLYALLHLWWALERVGGDGWRVFRPYDDQLVIMDASDGSKIVAVYLIAELYEHDGDVRELEALMKRVVQHCDDHGVSGPEVQMAALYFTRNSLFWRGRFQEGGDVERRLGELASPSMQLHLPNDCAGSLQMSTTFSVYGLCAVAAGRQKDAEEWFRKALKVQEGGDLSATCQIVTALFQLGRCLRQAGQLEEAEKSLRRALAFEETQLGPEDPQVAVTLHELGRCVREAGRLGEAEQLLRRALEIEQTKLGGDDPEVAFTLGELGVCVRQAGQPREAAGLLRRALEIEEAKLGANDPQVATTLRTLGECMREMERPVEAEAVL